jgi:signal transduction histidine kinase
MSRPRDSGLRVPVRRVDGRPAPGPRPLGLRFTRPLGRQPSRLSLPRRTIRLRLTALYGTLFLCSGALLLAITYALVSAATMGDCITRYRHGRGVSRFCGVSPPPRGLSSTLASLVLREPADVMHKLLLYSGVALAVMAILSAALGWLVAGRVLRPLRTITEAAHSISVTSMDRRLALDGPDDELKRLGNTFDELLDRLETAFDAQRRFVANASHELRTPLTLARALLQMALTDADATVDTFRSACAEAIAVGDYQERLIEALLVLARSERGLDRREPLDLAAITEEVVAGARDGAVRRGLQVHVAVEPARTDGDARLAERLVANLFDNALRYNAAGGWVGVATGTRDGRPFVTVANTGPVISADETRRLSEPFLRLDPDPGRGSASAEGGLAHTPGGASDTSGGASDTAGGLAQFADGAADTAGGAGLGLSIVHAIAAAHDATLTIAPRPAGGLDITVSFPPGTASPDRPRVLAAAAPRR